jgi:hypothetical protein
MSALTNAISPSSRRFATGAALHSKDAIKFRVIRINYYVCLMKQTKAQFGQDIDAIQFNSIRVCVKVVIKKFETALCFKTQL